MITYLIDLMRYYGPSARLERRRKADIDEYHRGEAWVVFQLSNGVSASRIETTLGHYNDPFEMGAQAGLRLYKDGLR